MLSTHQKQNTAHGEIYNLYTYRDCSLPRHFHKSFELAHLTQGKAQFTASEKTYSLTAGDFIMVLPFEVHGFTVEKDGILSVTVFSADLAGAFSSAVAGMRGETAVFRCGESVCRFFEDSTTNAPDKPSIGISGGLPERLRIKARIDAVCAEYLSAVPLYPTDCNSDRLLRILGYIEQNFREDISVGRIAKALGYSERSVSAVFGDTLRLSFRELLNQYRFEYAYQLLLNGNGSVTEVALESGFQSIRTFNRVFRELSGLTPRQAFARSGSAREALQRSPAEASADADHQAGSPE